MRWMQDNHLCHNGANEGKKIKMKTIEEEDALYQDGKKVQEPNPFNLLELVDAQTWKELNQVLDLSMALAGLVIGITLMKDADMLAERISFQRCKCCGHTSADVTTTATDALTGRL